MQARYGTPVPTLPDPEPSQADLDLTRRLSEVGRVVGIRVLDHVVIGQDRYFSFADEGLL